MTVNIQRRTFKETDLHLFSEVLDLKLTSDLALGFERELPPQMSTSRTSKSSSTTEPSTFEVQSFSWDQIDEGDSKLFRNLR